MLAKTAQAHAKLPGTVYSPTAAIVEAGGRALPIVGDIRSDDVVFDAVLQQVWIYLTAPPLGMLIAVGAAYILRGTGVDPDAIRAAQGALPNTPTAAAHAIGPDQVAGVRGCAGGAA